MLQRMGPPQGEREAISDKGPAPRGTGPHSHSPTLQTSPNFEIECSGFLTRNYIATTPPARHRILQCQPHNGEREVISLTKGQGPAPPGLASPPH